VDWKENNGPVQTSSRFDNSIISHFQKHQKDSGIDYASDKNPTSIKADGNEFRQQLRDSVWAFVRNSASDQEPRVDFHR
jgi:hypothetical protein